MPPIEIGSALPVGAVNTSLVRTPSGSGKHEKIAPSPGAVVKSDALDPGAPPIDADRIQVIRKAIETNTYPVLPAKVADAIIAAGLLLRTGK